MAVGNLTLALNTALGGLAASQGALGTISENVANANTPGYSRKIVNLETRVVAGVGGGVQVADVGRSIDEGLRRDLRRENQQLEFQAVQTSYLSRVQEVFGTPGDNTSFAHTMAEMNAALETLSANPSRSLEQAEFVRWAENLSFQLKDMTDTIQELRKNADDALEQVANDANAAVEQIVDMNNKIIFNKAVGNDVTDLQDKRDLALDDLSKYIDFTYFERNTGDIAVFTSSGKVLVDNTAQTISHVAAPDVSSTTTHGEGDFTGIFVGTPVEANDITTSISGGQLGGLVELRDVTLVNLQAELDEFSTELRDAMNVVHNRGVPFPGNTSLSGQARFVDPGAQTMQIGTNEDVRITIFDDDGNQIATTTLDAEININSAPAPTLTAVAAAIETWMTGTAGLAGATAAFDSEGKLNINTNNTTRFITFRDEGANQSLGATAQDVTITFDEDGTGTGDTREVSGFSNFFGLNDIFVTNFKDNIYDSDILNANFQSTAATLSFYDRDSTTAATMGATTISIASGSSLDSIITAINNSNIGVTASKVQEGTGYRLRFSNDQGEDMLVKQAAADTFLDDIGLEVSNVRASETLTLRDEIRSAPNLITTGSVQFDSTLGTAGEYYTSSADNTSVIAMAGTLNGTNTFDAAGNLDGVNRNFSEFATSILGRQASITANNELDVEIQANFVANLQSKSDNISGVNLDEELSFLILYEQSYSAAARVINVISEMFDTLNQAVS